MTAIYEIRAFNTKEGKQRCFLCADLRQKQKPRKRFCAASARLGCSVPRLIELGLPITVLADEIQLVAYNEAMTWLEEIKSWKAA